MNTTRDRSRPLSEQDREFLRGELARVEGRVMPFGAWKGMELRHVPPEYLAWAVRSIDLQPGLRGKILAVLSERVPPRPKFRPREVFLDFGPS